MTMYGVKFSDTKKVYSKEKEQAATPGPHPGLQPAQRGRLQARKFAEA